MLNNTITFICEKCGTKEKIPKGVVEMLDAFDEGDPSYPPRFTCAKCGCSSMYPLKYKNSSGITFEWDPKSPEKFKSD